jgi:hypothetical protein
MQSVSNRGSVSARLVRGFWTFVGTLAAEDAIHALLPVVFHRVGAPEEPLTLNTLIATPLRFVLVAVVAGLIVTFWDTLLDAAYYAQGLFWPRTYKQYISRLIRRIRALVADAKATGNVDDAAGVLMTPKGCAIVGEAHDAKVKLRDLLRDPATSRELTALETWPDDALAHMSDTFERLLTRIDPTVPAPQRLPRRARRKGRLEEQREPPRPPIALPNLRGEIIGVQIHSEPMRRASNPDRLAMDTVCLIWLEITNSGRKTTLSSRGWSASARATDGREIETKLDRTEDRLTITRGQEHVEYGPEQQIANIAMRQAVEPGSPKRGYLICTFSETFSDDIDYDSLVVRFADEDGREYATDPFRGLGSTDLRRIPGT